MDSLLPNNKTELLVSLREVTQELQTELNDTPPEEANFRPVQDEWSVKEIMCYLRDAEKIWNERLVRTIEEDEPYLQAFTPAELAHEDECKAADWEEVRVGFHTARLANLDILDRLEPAQWLKGAIHQERGHITITELAESLLTNTQTQLEQIKHTRWLAK